jgi:hypothetical protein
VFSGLPWLVLGVKVWLLCGSSFFREHKPFAHPKHLELNIGI